MKTRLTYILLHGLFIINVLHAQLAVRNGAYVFVNDEVLFVNDNVILQEANTYLYLRNEAQLIQGDGLTGNSGNGELSVYQTGTVNKWAYNFWCSPVGEAGGLGNTEFIANRMKDSISLINSTDFNFVFDDDGNHLASPVEISNRWIYTYEGSADYTNWNYVGSVASVSPGLGFTMKGTSGNPIAGQKIDFRGKPNNGVIVNNVMTNQFTLLGNPYPSAIDAYEFIHDPVNSSTITGWLLYWEQSTEVESHAITSYSGGYAQYTIDIGGTESFLPAVFYTYDASGNANPLPPGPPFFGNKVAYRYIPIGQGFLVEGAINGLARTTNDMRVYEKESNGNSYFFRGADNASTNQETQYNEYGLNIVPEDYKRFRLNVDFSNSGAQYTRQLLMNFHDNATTGFDYGLEAKLSEPLDSDTYWVQEDSPYSMQAQGFNEDLVLPLTLKISQPQTIQLRLFDVQNFNQDQDILLHDLDQNLYLNLKESNHSITLDEGIYENRFQIVFKQENNILSTNDFVQSNIMILQDNIKSLLNIKNPNLLNIKSIVLYDILGKAVLYAVPSESSNLYSFSTANLSNGVYVVKIGTENLSEVSQKIIISN